MSQDILRAALDALERGEAFAMITVLEVEGSAPASPGQRMLVFADGREQGTVGGGALERSAAEEAHQRLATGRSGVVTLELDPDTPGSIGSLCGGRAQLAVEVFAPSIHLLLCGAGHVSRAFAALCALLGWKHSVVDARPEQNAAERFPRAAARYGQDPAAFLAEASLEGFTHLLIFTHDHALDREALSAAVRSGFTGYVGLIGSARKWAETRRDLEAQGVPPIWLDAVRCPVGLPIGSRTPEEIAVAIAAEIIQERRS